MPRARARISDPHTSHNAARHVESRGIARNQRTVCLLAVVASPGSTAAEIAKAASLERHVPSRRLPELREAGKVYNRETRPCRVTGGKSMTWYIVEGEGQGVLF